MYIYENITPKNIAKKDIILSLNFNFLLLKSKIIKERVLIIKDKSISNSLKNVLFFSNTNS